ncbi:serine/threonine protein kinase, partial [Lysobacter sp. 2RAB21]
MPGGTLEAKLLTRSISPDEVRYIGLCLADVLDHLNDRRLVHRDIKPANILFASDGQTPILTDFGVVRVLDQPSLTRDFVGFGPGTPAYAAPEQLNNEKQLIDWRTDQFGLAVV